MCHEIHPNLLNDVLQAFLARIGARPIHLARDYYWHVPIDQLYDMSSSPDHLDIGQLTEDWECLLELLHDPDAPLSVYATKLSSLFQYIATAVGPTS